MISQGPEPRRPIVTGEAAQPVGRLLPRSPFALSVVGVLGTALLAAAMAAAFGPGPARAAAASGTGGEQLYVQHCGACHQATGQGIEGTFPPLAGNPAASDPAYVEASIREGVSGPIEVLGVSYDAIMPPVATLSDSAEIDEVVRYVVGLAGPADGTEDDEPAESDGSDGAADDAPTEAIVGDADRGRDLFQGSERFDNGGAACAACHTAGSVGNLGGPGLGPDLTDSFQALGGEVGLTSWMSNPPSQTMQPLFAERPLSEAELADVVAFLGDAPDQDRADSSVDRLTVAGLAGLAGLILAMAMIWRGMRQTYLERLRSRPATGRARARRTRSRNGSTSASTATRTDRQRQTAEAGRSRS